MSPGVPGIVGRASPRERPESPLVVPSLLRASAMSGSWRLGSCRAAEERRRRWPAEAEKEDWEASVNLLGRQRSAECKSAAGAWRAETDPYAWGHGRYRMSNAKGVAPWTQGCGFRRGQLALNRSCSDAARGGHTGAGRELRRRCGGTSKGGGRQWHLSE